MNDFYCTLQSMQREQRHAFDSLTAFLLLLAVLTSAGRLSVTNWTTGLELPTELAGIAVLFGIGLGCSRFRLRTVNLLALAYSLFFIPWLMGVILYFPSIEWSEKLLSMGGRLVEAIIVLFRGEELQDTFLFIFLVTVAYWTLGLISGYSLFRNRNYLAAILPGGLAMLIVQIYDPIPSRIGLLGFYLFLALLILGRLSYLEKHAHWKKQHAPLSAEVSTDLNLSILVTSTILVLVAWFLPAPANPITAARRLWWEVNQTFNPAREGLGNVIAGLQSSQPAASEPVGYNLYGETLAFGSRAASGNNTIFVVYPPLQANLPRYYWRVRTYDLYEGGEWGTSPLSTLDFTPEEANLVVPESGEKRVGEFTFVIRQENIFTFATPTEPIWISRPAEIQYVRAEENILEPVVFSSNSYLGAGDRYRVRAYINNPYVNQLDAAGTDYPAWVTSRYLQLPYDLSPRIVELAIQLTENEESPYDKVVAITNYLRDEIIYSKTIDPIPEGTDPVEWLLFESQEGFCNYYASAEVVMLRAIGIPARLAVGFSQGEREPGSANARRITRDNAHAWPEVYFPGLGWVEFEPTAGEPPLLRPVELTPDPDDPDAGTPPDLQGLLDDFELPAEEEQTLDDSVLPAEEEVVVQRSYGWAVFFIVLALGTFTAGILIWRRHITRSPVTTPLPVRLKVGLEERAINVPGWLLRWADYATQSQIQRAFGVVFRSLRSLSGELHPSDTPAEAAAALRALLPEAVPAIDALLNEYQVWLYSPEPGQVEIARAASGLIRKHARAAKLRKFLREIRVKFSRSSPEEKHVD